MKRLIMLLFCAVCTVSMTFAQDAKKKKDSVTFFIEAMDCDHCIKKIEKNIVTIAILSAKKEILL